MHSTASDGRLLPGEVMSLAHASGIEMVALTDHDTVGGVAEARECAFQLGMQFLVGCEISASAKGQEVHLLAYGFSPDNDDLEAFFDLQQSRRNDRADEFLIQLKKTGDISAHVKLPDPEPGRSVARPHIAQLLVEFGSAVDLGDAFRRFLTPGCKHFVPKPLPDGSEVVEVIHQANGIVVMAHPGHHAAHSVIMNLIGVGLDGLEVIHPSHDSSLERYYRNLAHHHSLIVTGGSDFHGTNRSGRSAMGDYWISPGPEILEMVWTQ